MIKDTEFEDIIIKSNAYFGIDNRLNKTMEECAEVIQAIAKFKSLNPEPGTEKHNQLIEHICEEISDVEIVIECLKKYLPKRTLDRQKSKKIKRLERRINGLPDSEEC